MPEREKIKTEMEELLKKWQPQCKAILETIKKGSGIIMFGSHQHAEVSYDFSSLPIEPIKLPWYATMKIFPDGTIFIKESSLYTLLGRNKDNVLRNDLRKRIEGSIKNTQDLVKSYQQELLLLKQSKEKFDAIFG